MKQKLLYLFLFVAAAIQAQVVNIPDAEFKSALLGTSTNSTVVAYNSTSQEVPVDANGDGQIQVSEALLIRKLSIYSPTANVTGITAFANLRYLQIYSLNLQALSLSSMPYLEELYCQQCLALTSLNINGLTSLKILDCSNTNVIGLSVQGLTSLQKINASGSQITGLNLSGLALLQDFTCDGSPINTLILSGNTSLKTLQCTGGFLTSLNLSAAPSLETLNCRQQMLTSLNTTGLAALKMIECSENQITGPVDLSTNTSLIEVYCNNNNITSIILGDIPSIKTLIATDNSVQQIQLGYLPSLRFLYLENNHLSSIDVSGCPMIDSLAASNNPLTYINMKNGEDAAIYFTGIVTNAAIPVTTICVDEGEWEESYFTNYYSNSTQQVNINTYCTAVPGGMYNTITGLTTYNSNNAGCSGALSGIRYKITGGMQGSTMTMQNGNYNFYTQTGNFTISPQLENPSWFTVSPPSASASFANANNNSVTKNFCIAPNGIHKDVEVMIQPVRNAQPGFDSSYRIIYRNKGNQPLSGQINLFYNDGVMDFVNTSVSPSTTSVGSIAWDYTNLQPFESRVIAVTLNMNGPTEVPALNNGDHLNFTASISPTTGDETPGDNTFTLEQTLTGSFDPNDITCLEGDTEHPDNIGKYLHYNINFENTGTVPATFIVVKDMIDTAKFDLASLQLITASHNVKTRINGNKVEFYFDAINLGPNQKGNVLFKIKTLPSLAVNSSVTQNANIYFDYNWPITTNDATTTFQLLSRGDFAQDTSVKLYPNPSSFVVTISAATTISTVQLYDVQGRLLEAVSPKLNEATVDISQRANGIYFMKISTGNGVKIEKVIKN